MATKREEKIMELWSGNFLAGIRNWANTPARPIERPVVGVVTVEDILAARELFTPREVQTALGLQEPQEENT